VLVGELVDSPRTIAMRSMILIGALILASFAHYGSLPTRMPSPSSNRIAGDRARLRPIWSGIVIVIGFPAIWPTRYMTRPARRRPSAASWAAPGFRCERP